jgi:hypothetical protein
MSLSDFIHQPLKREKKYPIGFETKSEENHLVVGEHTHLSLNIEPNYHYFGTAADSDSISTQVCLFHPYHPDLNCLDRTLGFPETPISFECPIECVNNLPREIGELLSEHKATKIFIRPFFQNMPWKPGIALLIRPNHVLFNPSTLEEKVSFMSGRYNGSKQCKMAILSEEKSIIIDRFPPNLFSPAMGFVSHPSGSGYTLCSPGMHGVISGINYEKTVCFYNIVVTTTNGAITPDSEWYISPTCLLNVEDFERILRITSDTSIRTIFDLVRVLYKENFSLANILMQLLRILPTDLI